MIDLAGIHIDQRIVVRGIGLDFDLATGQRDAIDDRPHILRQATQRIAILNQLADAMGAIARRFVGARALSPPADRAICAAIQTCPGWGFSAWIAG